MPGKILIVDDESSARAALETLLRREGYDVHDAADGRSALAACSDFKPDLILLDILMPGIDGFEVCRQLKADNRTKEIPVIFITAQKDELTRARVLEQGAVGTLFKPFSDVALREALNTAIGEG